jgi:geranylgeranyl transferase type-2 subunit beta
MSTTTTNKKYLPPSEIYDILLSSPQTSTSQLSPSFELNFKRMQHFSYILGVDDHDDQLYYHVTDYLKMSALYWALMALYISGGVHLAKKSELLQFIQQCYDPTSGGYRGNVNHHVHLLYTLSAVQILAIFEQTNDIKQDELINYVASLQRPNGSFVGDVWGEVDTRFSYCAILILAIINKIPPIEIIQLQSQPTLLTEDHYNQYPILKQINFYKAIEYVLSCRNFDGGFGAVSGGESHSGQIFCSLAFLCLIGILPYCVPVPNQQSEDQNTTSIVDSATTTTTTITTNENQIEADSQSGVLGWWLCERQLNNGGLNGRPEKKEDVCYSWWVLTGLTMLKKTHWINKEKLTNFILSCQDSIYGGISDRSNTMTDIYHTYFGIAGLSLLQNPGFDLVEPVYALPVSVVNKIGK